MTPSSEDTQRNKRYLAWGSFVAIIIIVIVSFFVDVKNISMGEAALSGFFLIIGAYMGLSTVIDHFSKDKKDK